MNYIITKSQYLETKRIWKSKSAHSSTELLIYNLLRGFPPERGFTPITNANKLANGSVPMSALNNNRFLVHRSLAAPTANHWADAVKNASATERYQNQLLSFGIAYDAELFAELFKLTDTKYVRPANE